VVRIVAGCFAGGFGLVDHAGRSGPARVAEDLLQIAGEPNSVPESRLLEPDWRSEPDFAVAV